MTAPEEWSRFTVVRASTLLAHRPGPVAIDRMLAVVLSAVALAEIWAGNGDHRAFVTV